MEYPVPYLGWSVADWIFDRTPYCGLSKLYQPNSIYSKRTG